MTQICYPPSSGLLSVSSALSAILTNIQPITAQERIHLSHALGRVLADDMLSPMNNPPERQSAMDGYAFSSADIEHHQPFDLSVIGVSWAGKPYVGPSQKGGCVRIFTGAVVPEFADSVIAQEQVVIHEDMITLAAATPAHKNIRLAGSDVRLDELMMTAPKKLTACDLGLLASVGIQHVQVFRQLKIGFFSTGDELIALDQGLQSGQIYDSNRYLLAGLLNDPNHIVTDLGVVQDDAELIEQTLQTAAEQFDVLISSGGASVGDKDFIKQTLEKCGQVNVWKLAIKPGKPLAFGQIGNCRFFGLPGNPVAVLVTFEKFVKPALFKLVELTYSPIQLLAQCETRLSKSPGRQEYQRGIYRQIEPGLFSVRAAGPQDSHQLKIAAKANCFIVLDTDCTGVEVGENVTIEPFGISTG